MRAAWLQPADVAEFRVETFAPSGALCRISGPESP